MITDRVKEILSWYKSESPGVQNNIARLLNTGTLAGTGKMVILPVDQGFEHGPHRSFGPNQDGNNPHYHYELAIESGCNAYAAPLGFLEAGAADFVGQMPTILKVNNSDSLFKDENPCSAVTSSVEDALRLGCSAIGFTIYPGSAQRNTMYEQIRELIAEARSVGLPTVMWSYPRGAGISKKGETAIDVVAYAAHIAAELGAHIIKVKPPTDHLEQDEAKKVYKEQGIKIDTLTDRVRHVVQSTFAGRRIVIFSGGASKDEPTLMKEIKEIHDGGGFGSIIGRNSFQRPREDGVRLLKEIMNVYRS